MTRREEELHKLYSQIADAERERSYADEEIKLASKRIVRAERIIRRARQQIADLIVASK